MTASGKTLTARKFATATGWSYGAICKNVRGEYPIKGQWLKGVVREETDEGSRWRIPVSEVERFKRLRGRGSDSNGIE